MRSKLAAFAILFALVSPSYAANTSLSGLSAASSVSGTDLFYDVQTAGSGGVKATASQLSTYVKTQLGTAALANTGTSGATLGLLNTANTCSAVQTFSAITLTGASGCAQFTGGVLGFTGTACGGSGSTGANPSATAGPTANNGSASTFMRSDASPAIQLGSASQAGLLQCGTGLTCTGGTASVSAGGSVSLTGALGISVSPNPITGTGVISGAVTQRNNTTTTDALVTGDGGTVVTESNAAAIAVSIAQAGSTGFASGWFTTLKNKNTGGLVTITPATSTIDGSASITVWPNQSLDIYSDGTNYFTLPGRPFYVGGAVTLGTAAIASGACATVVQGAAASITTTSTIVASFNGDPTAVTGYIPSTSGGLNIYVYPTAGNANFKVCNPSSSSITPGPVTLNWKAL